MKSRNTAELPKSAGLAHPIWSPDGRFVAAITTDDRRLMLFDFDSVNLPVCLTTGRFVYFQNLLDAAEYPIFRVAVADDKIEKVATSNALLRADFASYALIGLTPDDSPLVSLNRSSTDVYALDVDLP